MQWSSNTYWQTQRGPGTHLLLPEPFWFGLGWLWISWFMSMLPNKAALLMLAWKAFLHASVTLACTNTNITFITPCILHFTFMPSAFNPRHAVGFRFNKRNIKCSFLCEEQLLSVCGCLLVYSCMAVPHAVLPECIKIAPSSSYYGNRC